MKILFVVCVAVTLIAVRIINDDKFDSEINKNLNNYNYSFVRSITFLLEIKC